MRTSEIEAGRQFHRFLWRMAAIVSVGYVILWFAIASKWEPGNQEAIYREYKTKTQAVETASK